MLAVSVFSIGLVVHAQQPAAPAGAQAPATPAPAAPAADANGNPLRRAAKTGHLSNYDEAKVAPYTLPDPLVLSSGKRVTDAAAWRTLRRPEIMKLYETEIFGRIPSNTPKVTWQVSDTDAAARDGAAVLKHVVGIVGSRPDAPHIKVTLYTPAKASGPVPVILLANFGGGTTPARGGVAQPGDPPVAAEILARGWGYAMVAYQDIQPDRANSMNEGVIGATMTPGQQQPGPDEWGSIGAWAWGISRIIDYLQTDKAVDANRIALFGHSRLGKT